MFFEKSSALFPHFLTIFFQQRGMSISGLQSTSSNCKQATDSELSIQTTVAVANINDINVGDVTLVESNVRLILTHSGMRFANPVAEDLFLPVLQSYRTPIMLLEFFLFLFSHGTF